MPLRSLRCTPRTSSPSTTRTTRSPSYREAWLGPRYQITSQVNVVNPGRQAAGSAPRLPPGFRGPRRPGRLPRARAPHVAGADPAGRGGPLRHADRERADDAAALLPAVRRRLHRVLPAGVHRVLRRTPRAGPAAHRAMRCSSTPRCITARAPTSRPTSGGWPTCCRSRRRSAARWRRWTAPRWCGRSIRHCWR